MKNEFSKAYKKQSENAKESIKITIDFQDQKIEIQIFIIASLIVTVLIMKKYTIQNGKI